MTIGTAVFLSLRGRAVTSGMSALLFVVFHTCTSICNPGLDAAEAEREGVIWLELADLAKGCLDSRHGL